MVRHALNRVLPLVCAVLMTAAVFITLPAPAHAAVYEYNRFAFGWTNIVSTGGAGDVVFYKRTAGGTPGDQTMAVSGRFDDLGHFQNNGTTTGLSTDWDIIVGSPSIHRYGNGAVSDLLFYNRATGAGIFAHLWAGGYGSIFSSPNCTTLPFKPGWTNIIWTDAGLLLFFDGNTGQLVTGTFDPPTCQFTNLKSQTPSQGVFCSLSGGQLGLCGPSRVPTADWHFTHVAAAGNRVLIYDVATGHGVTGFVDVGGFHLQMTDSAASSPGWRVAGVGGRLLFYNPSLAAAPCYAAFDVGIFIEDIGPTGTLSFTGSSHLGTCEPVAGWSNRVLFYNRETGQAAFGALTKDKRSLDPTPTTCCGIGSDPSCHTDHPTTARTGVPDPSDHGTPPSAMPRAAAGKSRVANGTGAGYLIQPPDSCGLSLAPLSSSSRLRTTCCRLTEELGRIPA